jgi:hypothetical protein
VIEERPNARVAKQAGGLKAPTCSPVVITVNGTWKEGRRARLHRHLRRRTSAGEKKFGYPTLTNGGLVEVFQIA